MKISNNNKIADLSKKDTTKKQANNSKTHIQKEVQANALDVIGVQNQSFCGLLSKPTYAQFLHQDLKMEPKKEYVVTDDSVFRLGSSAFLDLSSNEIKQMIQSLKPNEYIDFGRNETPFSGMNNYVSGTHLRLHKKRNGSLVATDLGSTNGTVICKNLTETPDLNKSFQLVPNAKYELPLKGAIKLCKDEILYLPNLEKKIKSMKEGESIIVGRDPSCDIRFEEPSVSRKHLSLTKHENNVIAKDLGSTNGANYIPSSNIYVEDNNVSKLEDIMLLKPETPTKIPNDCQLYLGENFTIDVRNPNILELLNKYGSITLGRTPYSAIQVNEFYNKVSKQHLKLEKFGNDIYATDLGSRNGTKVVPHSRIKPFYCDLAELELAQANVGDCYLLSTIYGMSRTTKGRELLEKMVSVDNQGNYIVSFHNRQPITVKLEELDGQRKNNQEKRSVSGDLGIKAIERAYAKMLKEEDFRAFFANNESNQTMFLAIDDGGFMSTALRKMTGIQTHKIPGKNPGVKNIFQGLSQNLDNYVVTCSTYNKGKYGNYMDPQGRFLCKHAYSIKSIDALHQTVEIVNPHNTKNTIHITWDKFQEMFDYLCYANVSA